MASPPGMDYEIGQGRRWRHRIARRRNFAGGNRSTRRHERKRVRGRRASLDQLNGVLLRDPQQDSGQRFRQRLFSTALAYARASETVMFGWGESCEAVLDRVVTTSRLTPDPSGLRLLVVCRCRRFVDEVDAILRLRHRC